MIKKQIGWQTVPLQYPTQYESFRKQVQELQTNGWEVMGQTYGGMRHNDAGVNVDFFFIHVAKYEWVDEVSEPKVAAKKAGRPKKDA